MFTKWWTFTTKKHLVTSLLFLLKFSNKFNVGTIYGFKVGVIRIFLIFLFISVWFMFLNKYGLEN
jgi:hypothetical protein